MKKAICIGFGLIILISSIMSEEITYEMTYGLIKEISDSCATTYQYENQLKPSYNINYPNLSYIFVILDNTINHLKTYDAYKKLVTKYGVDDHITIINACFNFVNIATYMNTPSIDILVSDESAFIYSLSQSVYEELKKVTN